ncbi:hypothetical protein ACS0TY_014885 [Phlomoides rotata]
MFLSILVHHTKNRCVKFMFKRSECILKFHNLFLVQPQPISDDSSDNRWGNFKGMVCCIIMDHQGNVIGSDGEKGEISIVRRSWSRAEEDALIRCLSDIVNDGWKIENDFK